MTEEEAKTKWCPYARCADAGKSISGFNRWDDYQAPNPSGSVCIGSKCMAWRNIREIAETKKAELLDKGSLVVITAEITIVGGYCGLAGKP